MYVITVSRVCMQIELVWNTFIKYIALKYARTCFTSRPTSIYREYASLNIFVDFCLLWKWIVVEVWGVETVHRNMCNRKWLVCNKVKENSPAGINYVITVIICISKTF